MDEIYDYIVVGSGITGLTVASVLKEKGKSVLIIDKGRQVGGRMACRKAPDFRFDHGAQYFRGKTEEFLKLLNVANKNSVIKLWESVAKKYQLNPPCYVGKEGMTSLPKFMATNLKVLLSEKVSKISFSNSLLSVETESKKLIKGRAIILTAPLPQSLDLLSDDLFQDKSLRTNLLEYNYYKTLAVLLGLEKEILILNGIGGIKDPTENISWVGSNYEKGISKKSALTIHFNYDYSEKCFEEDERKLIEIAIMELSAIFPKLPRTLSSYPYSKVHRWRYSSPKEIFKEPFIKVSREPQVFLAGDIFAGPRVEGGFISGFALGKYLINDL